MSFAEQVERMIGDRLDAIEGDFVVPVEAAKFVAQLREQDPALFADWLDDSAVRFMSAEFQRRLGYARQAAARSAKRRPFIEAGADPEALSQFAVTFVVDGDLTRRRVADMTGDDHRFVAEDYGSSGRNALMLEAFHLAVARKVGAKRTADVMSEGQYADLFASIAGRVPSPTNDTAPVVRP